MGEFKIDWRGIAYKPKVNVKFSKCNGCGACVKACIRKVFELKELPDYLGALKAFPSHEKECIMCVSCVVACPSEAITVEDALKGGF